MSLRLKSALSGFQEARTTPRRGFTLVEIMIVVAILGLVLTTGIPPMAKAIQRRGMNKAIVDVYKACEEARQAAVISQTRSDMVIHPQDGTVQGGGYTGQIPGDVRILLLGVNFIEFQDMDEARVGFYPNGTSDEFSLTLQGENGEVREIYLDIVTGAAQVKEH